MAKPTAQKITRVMDKTRRLMTEAVHFQQQGEFAEAESRYKSVLKEETDHPDALHFLGLLMHQRDGSPESMVLMRKSLANGQLNAGYMVNFARVLQAHAQYEESTQFLRKALALSPTFVEAWICLGQSYDSLNMPFKALECFRKAYEIDPSNAESAQNLIRSLRETGNPVEAATICEHLLQENPKAWHFTHLEVTSLMEAGKTDEALEKMRTALRVDPLSAQLHYCMGNLMANLGNFEMAKEHYAQALAIDPQFYPVYYSLSLIQTLKMDDPIPSQLELKIQQSPPNNPHSAVFAEFSLGEMFDDRGEYDRAFKHFQLGNKIMRGLIRYNSTSQSEYADSLVKYLDENFINRHTKIGSNSEIPVFIIGMIRSGTSLVEQILASHPQVAGAGELIYLPLSLRKYLQTPSIISGDKIANLPDSSLRDMGEFYLARITAMHPHKLRITDKLPGNFMLLGLIYTLFPMARIIHCRRDPLDTCFSCYTKLFNTGHQYAYDMTEIGEYYRIYNRVVTNYERIIDPARILTIEYEDLVNDLEGTSRKMLKFCGLEWDSVSLEFYKTQRAITTTSMYQVRQPLYTHSIGRWKRYASYLEPLRKGLGDVLGSTETK
jgi:tetratricopeptide (TPR) repeat protein